MQAPSWLLAEVGKEIPVFPPCALTAKNESTNHRSSEQDQAPADPQSITIAEAKSEALIRRHNSPLMLTGQSKADFRQVSKSKV